LALINLQIVGGPAVPTLVDLLSSKHVDVRRMVPHLLRASQVGDKMVVIGLGYALKDADSQVRLNSLLALYTLAGAAKLAAPYVSAALIDIDPEVRRQAFGTLRNMGVDPRPGLKKALAHADFAVRLKTASLMSDLNLEVDLAEPVLLEGLKQKDEALKMQA